MRQFIPREFVPGERRSKTSGKKRWGMNEKTCKKILVTLLAVLRGLGDVLEPIQANFFGTLPLECFFSCLRRICHSNKHYPPMMEMLRLALLMITIRCRRGLTPGFEEGTKRQKRGDALFTALPASAEDLPMGHIMCIVATAIRRSLVHLPDAFLDCWAGLGVLAQPDGVPCSIEDLVVLSRERRPATARLRNSRFVATGGGLAR
jgi:hypothetical protein